jgi:hypothetical protein
VEISDDTLLAGLVLYGRQSGHNPVLGYFWICGENEAAGAAVAAVLADEQFLAGIGCESQEVTHDVDNFQVVADAGYSNGE